VNAKRNAFFIVAPVKGSIYHLERQEKNLWPFIMG
jgi:hypothetical protein